MLRICNATPRLPSRFQQIWINRAYTLFRDRMKTYYTNYDTRHSNNLKRSYIYILRKSHEPRKILQLTFFNFCIFITLGVYHFYIKNIKSMCFYWKYQISCEIKAIFSSILLLVHGKYYFSREVNVKFKHEEKKIV